MDSFLRTDIPKKFTFKTDSSLKTDVANFCTPWFLYHFKSKF